MTPRFTSGLVCFLTIPLIACGDSLQDNLAVWEAMQPHAYVFEYQRSCFCPGSGAWWKITVRGDSVVGVELVDTAEAQRGLDVASRGRHPTISLFFEYLERDSARPFAKVQVEYHRIWHFPVWMDVDPIRTAIDDEWKAVIHGFHPIP
jgi:hypothetical protein